VNGDERVRRQLEDLELQAGGELVVRRVLYSCGRTRAFINGKLATQQALADITRGLTDISSQHEHHTLSDPSTHLSYLDAFAGVSALRQRMSKTYQALRQAEQALRDFAERLRDREAREAVLAAQLKEIEEVAPELLEDTLLDQTCVRLRNAERLSTLVAEAVDRLYESDGSVVDSLAQVGRSVTEAAELDPPLGGLAAQLEALMGQLEDVSRELVRHMRDLRADPETLQRAEERSYQIAKLKRRYGGTIEGVLAHAEKGRSELEALTSTHGRARPSSSLVAGRSKRRKPWRAR
jgi:DNA repair protein RecN (Recombination protein N)